MLTTQFILTMVVFAAALALIARMVILERRPRDNLNPRLVPTEDHAQTKRQSVMGDSI